MTSSKPTDQNYTSLASIKSSSTSSQLIDILISNVWPDGITGFSAAPLPAPELSSIGVDPVAEVVRRTKPRYHFTAGGGHPPRFWEREPYTWDNAEDKGRIGRFVSLGAFGGEQPPGKKPRWFYAFSIAALSATSEPPPKPANATQNPFLHRAPKRRLESGVQQLGKRSRTDAAGADASQTVRKGSRLLGTSARFASQRSTSLRTARSGRSRRKDMYAGYAMNLATSFETVPSKMQSATPAVVSLGTAMYAEHAVASCITSKIVQSPTKQARAREGVALQKRSGRVLVLLVESQLGETSHRINRFRVLCDVAKRATHPHPPGCEPPKCAPSTRRRPCPHRPYHPLSDVPLNTSRPGRTYYRRNREVQVRITRDVREARSGNGLLRGRANECQGRTRTRTGGSRSQQAQGRRRGHVQRRGPRGQCHVRGRPGRSAARGCGWPWGLLPCRLARWAEACAPHARAWTLQHPVRKTGDGLRSWNGRSVRLEGVHTVGARGQRGCAGVQGSFRAIRSILGMNINMYTVFV
ncbi:hypothetical protein GSI_14031 [Ganoderma sinense ZZ0214-1]|uniref:Uncharacterized protein n=1 Tax=Ganoderma sinense ZZ0214-1 TaxID=1077348 RepID=A0A2G8RSF9_9APHY|nr:hypothetical protein GSI_14031 [Ganoderma sinense ZZ0214-1]